MLSVVGIGPGNPEDMTPRARGALREAEQIVGYQRYLDLIRNEFPDKEYFSTGMRGELERVHYAVDSALGGVKTAVISSGDAAVYGMASLVLEVALEKGIDPGEIEIIPGITAALSCGAILGSPLSCDFAVISLSDQLVPWERIEKRLEAAARGDFPVVLYNPSSRQRKEHLRRACEIIRKWKSPDTVCAVVRNAGREGQESRMMSLAELAAESVDMLSTVFIGSADTVAVRDRMITPRGYQQKYGCLAGGETGHPDRIGSPGLLQQNGREIPNDPGHSQQRNKGRKLLIFGGTTEGRKLAGIADEAGYRVTLSVVSAYGRETAEQAGAPVEILEGRMPETEIRRLLESGRYDCVMDATHPYATHISGSIARAAADAGVRCICIRREIGTGAGEQMIFPDVASAIHYLNSQQGNVFFATGSNAAEQYVKLKDLKDRGYIRILPSETALRKVREAGFRSSHILCMQGPFTEEMNMACFHYADAEWLVTKASGKEGGYDSKVSAAEKLGIRVLVIRPPDYSEKAQICHLEEAEQLIRAGEL